MIRRTTLFRAAPHHLIRRLVPWLAVLTWASTGCTASTEDEATQESTLSGSAGSSIPAISQRNSITTQAFAITLTTPDGRLGVEHLGGRTMRVKAFGDPQLSVTGAGGPRFAASMATGATIDLEMPPFAARSMVLRRSDGAGPLQPAAATVVWSPQGQGSLSLDPRFSPAGKPFPVDSPSSCIGATPATRESLVSPSAPFECYRLLHFQAHYSPDCVPGQDPATCGFALLVAQAELAVVVDARRPDTTSGFVARAANPNVVAAQYLTGAFQPSTSTGQPLYLWGLETSFTADSRLMVSEGARWAYNETPWNPSTWTTQRNLETLYDSVRTDVEGVRRICRRIDPTSGNPSCAAGEEEDFVHVYPLAAQPIFLSDGSRARPEHHRCGYMWITPEGTDVFCRPNPAGGATPALELVAGFESSTGMQFFSAGMHTGYVMRRIDGGVNIRRFNPEMIAGAADLQLHRPFSPMFLNTSTGFWAENRTRADRSLPMLRQWPLFEFMTVNHSLNFDNPGAPYPSRNNYLRLGLLPTVAASMQTNMQYWEASFACGVSPRCLLHLPMNELFYDDVAAASTPRLLRALPSTGDASNNSDFFDAGGAPLVQTHPYVGQLSGSARFIGEVYGEAADERYRSGYRGTAVSLGATGAVRVLSNAADNPACRRNKGCLAGETFTDGFTAELAFLFLFDPASTSMPLAQHHGLWSLRLENGGLVAEVSYRSAGGIARRATLGVPGPLPFSQRSAIPGAQAVRWRHVALRVSPARDEIVLFVDGTPRANVTLERGATLRGAASAGELVRIGPAGTCTNCPANDALFVDELVFNRAALTSEEIAASASAFAGRSDFLSAAQTRTLLGRQFRLSNPRQLNLAGDGFPRFVRPEDLRVPAAFASFLSTGRDVAFRRLVDVGDALFHSPVLSTSSGGTSQTQAGTGEPMSCATCHREELAFTDGRATAVGIAAFGRNTPTIFNRAFGTNQFFARRARDLVDLALQPVVNAQEMNGNLDRILQRINTGADQTSLRQGFANVFGATPVTREHLSQALTAYMLVQLDVQSLGEAVIASGQPVTDSDGALLSPDVLRLGKELFEGKARCSACHIGPNFTDELAHDTGVASMPEAFKTPTLWNVAHTAPYFHDGSRSTLRDVIEFYNRGGDGLARSRDGLRMVDPELRPLALSARELSALELYVRSIQNAAPASDGPQRLSFSSAGPIPGMWCLRIQEPADTAGGWDNNYLCSPHALRISWSSTGPIAGMRCTQLLEYAEPSTTGWNNNFVCVPNSSPFGFSWSMAGPIAGKQCVRFLEPSDPNTWADNYLCYERPATLYAITKTGTSSGMTEVTALSGFSEYDRMTAQWPTLWGPLLTPNDWNFAFADHNRDGTLDFYSIRRANTGSGTTEVHVMNGATGFQTFLANTTTALPVVGTDNRWEFTIGDYNRDGVLDLFAIFKLATGSSMTEVHVMNGADNFSTFLLHAATGLGEVGTGNNAAFALGDYNRDGIPDLYLILKAATGSGKTEVHVLNGADGYRTFLVQVATSLGLTGTDEAWKFSVADHNQDGWPDVYAVYRTDTRSGRTAVHILDGAAAYTRFLLQRPTALPMTGNDTNWSFDTE